MNTELIEWAAIKLQPSRQRKDYPGEHIGQLAASIQESGLLHAPVLSPDGVLVAGECRRQAIKVLMDAGESFHYNGERIPSGLVPVIRTHHTSDLDLYRIELEENIRRKNLSHLEQAQATAQLHRLMKERNPNWTKLDTGKAVADLRGTGHYPALSTEVGDALLLDQFADNPEVKSARTKGQAVRIAKKLIERELMAKLGSQVDIGGYRKRHTLIPGDAFQVVPGLDKDQFDCILTDPPYGIAADAFGGASFLGKAHEYKDTEEAALKAAKMLAEEGQWLLKETGHLFMFCAIEHFGILRSLFNHAGWQVWKTPLIWYKGPTAHAPQPDYGPKRTYECILFANKGMKRVLKTGQDVLQFNSVFRDHKVHPAEKPSELLYELLSWSCHPGSKVLDPFAGSGSIFRAAEDAGCDATGIEMDEQYASICEARIKEIVNATPSTETCETTPVGARSDQEERIAEDS